MASPVPQHDALVYAAVALLGVALLSPWNITLNALNYFYTLNGRNDFAFLLTAVNGYPGLPMLFLLVGYGNRVSLTLRIFGSCMLQALAMALVPILSPLSPVAAPLGIMVISGICTNILQSSLLGLCGMLPPEFNLATLAGQGIAGILASLAQILVKVVTAAQPKDVNGNIPDSVTRASASAYFAFAAILMASSGALYLVALRRPFLKYYIQRGSGGKGPREDGGSGWGSDTDEGEGGEEGGVDVAVKGLNGGRGPMGGLEMGDDGEGVASQLLLKGGEGAPPRVAIQSVLRKVWPNLLSVHLVFLATFLMFPGVLLERIPYKNGFGASGAYLASDYWWSVMLLLTFNVCDTVGRVAPSFAIFRSCMRESWLLPATLARLVFVPIFLGCSNSWSPFFNDYFAICATIVFAFSNGFLASLGIMWAPAHVAPHEGETAGFAMSLVLTGGIVLGSNLALAL